MNRRLLSMCLIIAGLAAALPTSDVALSQTAETSVTVGAFAYGTNLDQLRNLVQGWANGDLNASNSAYAEGDSVPFRFYVTGLQPGQTYNFTIEFEWTKSGIHAYDYLTSYDRTEAGPIEVLGGGPCGNTSTAAEPDCEAFSVVTSFPNPSDPSSYDSIPDGVSLLAAGCSEYALLVPRGEFAMKAYHVAGIEFGKYTFTGSGGDLTLRLPVQFTTSTGMANGGSAGFYWGGHIAKGTPRCWGIGYGASSIRGAPFHMRAVNFMGGGGANQDRSLQPGAVVDCPVCDVTGADSLCPGATSSYDAAFDDTLVNPAYKWTVSGCGTISGADNEPTVKVQAGDCCADSFTLTLTTMTGSACAEPVIMCSKTVAVGDTEAPKLTCPADKRVECDEFEALIFEPPTAVDNCDPAPEVTWEDQVTEGTCAPRRVVTRTWTATDRCGNRSQCVQTFTVEDKTPPGITCPPDKVVECKGDVPKAATNLEEFIELGGKASDNCGATSVTWVGDVSDGKKCPEMIIRTYKATDACGNSKTCSQKIIVNDTTPPDITCPPDKVVECKGDVPKAATNLEEFIELGGKASDNCGEVNVTWVGDASDGQKCPETITRTYKATDACGNSKTCPQKITVDDTTPPDITCPPDKVVECKGDVPKAATNLAEFRTAGGDASDNCGEVSVTWVGDASDGKKCPETIIRTYKAADACGNSRTCPQKFVVDDKNPPIITVDQPPPVCEGSQPVLATATATDRCVGPVPVTCTRSDGKKCDEPFPLGKTVVTYTAKDACGNEATVPVDVKIYPKPSCEITNPAPKTLCGPDGMKSYLWTFPDGSEKKDKCITMTVGGVYRLKVVADNEGTECEAECSRDMSGPTACTLTQPSDLCEGESLLIAATDIQGGTEPFTVDWYNKANPVPGVDTPFEHCTDVKRPTAEKPACPVIVTAAGVYTSIVTDYNGYATSCWKEVRNNPKPVCRIVPPAEPPLCIAPANKLQAEVSGGTPGYTLKWTVAGLGWKIDSGDETDTITYTSGISVGTFKLCVTDSKGCSTCCELPLQCTHKGNYATLTQGAYGNENGMFNGVRRLELIQGLIGTEPIVVGMPGRSVTIAREAAQCIIDRLPAGGTAVPLPAGLGDQPLDPATCQTPLLPNTPQLPLNNGRFRNVLLGQTITLTLNTRLDPELLDLELCQVLVTQAALPGPDGLLGTVDDELDPGRDGVLGTSDDPVITVRIPLEVLEALSKLGWTQTVPNLLKLANLALADEDLGGASIGAVNAGVDAINRGFDQCRFLIACTDPCSAPYDPTADSDGDGVVDECDNCVGVANPDQADSNYDGIGDACNGSGDFDRDGDADIKDFLSFQGCFNGPNRRPIGRNCDVLDFDADGDVDIADFMTFHKCFNGPNHRPKC